MPFERSKTKSRISRSGKAVALVAAVLFISSLFVLWQFWLHPRDETNSNIATSPSVSVALIARFENTRLLNEAEILDAIGLRVGKSEEGRIENPNSSRSHFLTHSPYEPRYRESYTSTDTLRYPLPKNPLSYELDTSNNTFIFFGREEVLRWYVSRDSSTEVCAVQFVDSTQIDYRLSTFTDREAALKADYVVTHNHHCGTCSSLRNLAVYMAKPDLTTPTRTCARKLTQTGIKTCLMEELGFEESCAETWSYNVQHTRRYCTATCIDHYGLWNVLTNDMDDVHADERGRLNPCLECDEFVSGPGFQYGAGRTRRNSGLSSAIVRPLNEIDPVDHRLYFEKLPRPRD